MSTYPKIGLCPNLKSSRADFSAGGTQFGHVGIKFKLNYCGFFLIGLLGCGGTSPGVGILNPIANTGLFWLSSSTEIKGTGLLRKKNNSILFAPVLNGIVALIKLPKNSILPEGWHPVRGIPGRALPPVLRGKP